MLGAFAVAIVGGVGFVAITLDRFFEGDPRYLAVAEHVIFRLGEQVCEGVPPPEASR